MITGKEIQTENHDLNISNYRQSDFKKLLYTFRLCVPEFFAPDEEQDYIDYLYSHAENYYTIRYDELIVGGAGYKVNKTDKVGSISWIFLHPDYFGKGLGKKAVFFLLKILNEIDVVKVLRTETSQHGYQFFGSFGFTIVKKKKEYWGRGLDLYRMEMRKDEVVAI